MLFHHDDIDSSCVLESEEAKASRSTSSAITHDSALDNFSELGKIILEGFCENVSVLVPGDSPNVRKLPSVVSQLSPPINIFLHGNGVSHFSVGHRGIPDRGHISQKAQIKTNKIHDPQDAIISTRASVVDVK